MGPASEHQAVFLAWVRIWPDGDPLGGFSLPPQPCRAKYSTFGAEGVLGNVLGLLLVGFGGTVLYILRRSDWKRPPQAEEQALSMDFKTLTEGDSPSSQ